MSSERTRLVIGFGSETGNARRLAERLASNSAFSRFRPTVGPLVDLDVSSLDHRDHLVIVSSSFGDGEPPANAESFTERLREHVQPAAIRYAIFGIGDVAYPSFCGFTKTLDNLLLGLGAKPFVTRVDADTDFEAFFEIWSATLLATLGGDVEAGMALDLQVKSYGENNTFAASILEREKLNGSAPFAWHYRFDITGSGINYRAGDNLYLVPENDPDLLSGLSNWFGSDEAAELLRSKELRIVGKSFLRQFARLTESDSLKDLLKVANKRSLDSYLYGRDLLDILQDFSTLGAFNVVDIATHLPAILPRAYSIASHGNSEHIDLCVRDVSYDLLGRQRRGAATGYLAASTKPVPIFVRANPRFHLPANTGEPIIMIGTGTGIGPFMGLLEQGDRAGRSGDTLVFGDRRSSSDFLYQNRIKKWQQTKVIGQFISAFSRDRATPYYVQDAILDNAHHIWPLLDQGAHVYVCGSKANLDCSIDQALRTIATTVGERSEEDAQAFVQEMVQSQRLHKELY